MVNNKKLVLFFIEWSFLDTAPESFLYWWRHHFVDPPSPLSSYVIILQTPPPPHGGDVICGWPLGWAKMHEVFKSLLPRYFLKDIYVKWSQFEFQTIWSNFHYSPRRLKFLLTIILSTVIPRLARFLIARICIARIFEVAKTNFHSTILYLYKT